MSTTLPRLRVAFRLARRDLAAHKIRTVVALLLFALPVALVTGFVSTMLATDHATGGSPVSEVGNISPTVEPGTTVDRGTVSSQHEDITGAIGSLADSLSPGVLQTSEFSNGDRDEHLEVLTLSPSQDGTGPEVEPGTVHLNDNAAFLMDVDNGDTVTVDGAELTVQLGAGYQGSVVSTGDVPVNEWAMNVTWHFPDDDAVADDIVTAWDTSTDEITVTSSVFNPNYTGGFGFDPGSVVAVLGVLVLGILLVSSVITPVFAVAARRQRQAMGLMGATGAAPRDLRLVMLAEGLLVGVTGTALGLALSTAVMAGIVALTPAAAYGWSWTSTAVAAVVAAIALVCSVTSALVPAVRAGREDPVQALADGGSVRMTGFRWRMLVGPAFLVPGAVLVVTSDYELLILGVALCGIGVVLSSSLIVWLMSRLGNVLPTAGRLAVRDSLRNNHRTVPAVAAIAGVTFLATVVLTLPYDTDTPSPFRDDAVVASTFQGGDESLYRGDIEQIGDRMGADSHHTLSHIDGRSADGTTYSASIRGSDQTTAPVHHQAWSDLRATDGGLFAAYAGAAGSDVQTASDALAAGQAVVSDPTLLDDGELVIELREYDPYVGYVSGHSGDEPGPADDTVSVPGVAVPGLAGTGALDGAALSPGTAESLDLDTSYQGAVLLLDSPVSTPQAAAVATSLWPVNSPNLHVDTPAVDGQRALMISTTIAMSWLLTLGTVLLVVLLAATESRRDMATITAVGAAPGLLRRFSATQAVFIAASGTLVGVLVGFLPRMSQTVSDLVSGTTLYGFLTPSQWLAVGLTAVVGPVLAWVTGTLIGSVTSRDRSPVRRR